MAQWLSFSLLAAALWGFWAILFKLAVGRMSTIGAKLWETMGFALATIPILIFIHFAVVWNARGFLFSVLGGVTGGLANYFFFASFSKGGKASIVTPLVATCPIFTILCAYVFLREHINWHQRAACLCAIAAAALMAD